MKIVEKRKCGRADVFNMEVNDTHDFVIQGGVIAHNCADTVRYFCMSRPISPPIPKPKDDWATNPAHLFLDIDRSQLQPRHI